jgi:hypothetical protein
LSDLDAAGTRCLLEKKIKSTIAILDNPAPSFDSSLFKVQKSIITCGCFFFDHFTDRQGNQMNSTGAPPQDVDIITQFQKTTAPTIDIV